jgi:hypothetical protein
VGRPRVASAFTGRSSSESNAKSTGADAEPAAATAQRSPPTRLTGALAFPHEKASKATTAAAPPAWLVVAFLPDELVFTVRKEHVERGERSVAPGHVLL